MGFFAGLNDEKYDRQYTDRELMRRIFEYFKSQTTRLVWVLVLVVVLAGIGAALPVVVAPKTPLIFREWHPGVELAKGALDIPYPVSSPELRYTAPPSSFAVLLVNVTLRRSTTSVE